MNQRGELVKWHREQVADEFVEVSREGRLHGWINGVRLACRRGYIRSGDLTRITGLAEPRAKNVDELVRSLDHRAVTELCIS